MTILFPRHLMPAWYWQFSDGLSKWSRNMFVFSPSQKKMQYCWKKGKKCPPIYCQKDNYEGPAPLLLGGGEWVSKRNEQVYTVIELQISASLLVLFCFFADTIGKAVTDTCCPLPWAIHCLHIEVQIAKQCLHLPIDWDCLRGFNCFWHVCLLNFVHFFLIKTQPSTEAFSIIQCVLSSMLGRSSTT